MDVIHGLPAYAATGRRKMQRDFGSLLRHALGERAWLQLEPAIRTRFQPQPGRDEQRFDGTMHWTYCSPLGALISRLIERASILPTRCGRTAKFTFRIARNEEGFTKERTYRWQDGGRFTFRSVFGDSPSLHEEFGAGLGMYIQLQVASGALIFRDRGYFFRIGRWRIPLPGWATVGRFELLHRGLDARRFQVVIRVHHWLFGTLFYQRGEFQEGGGDAERVAR